MLVKCIKSDYFLTIGKIYDAGIDAIMGDAWYYISNDQDKKNWYPKECLKPLSEIRNEKINKLLEYEN